MRLVSSSAWLVAASMVACGGGAQGGSASVKGTIGGGTVATNDAYGANETISNSSGFVTTVRVSITSLGSICSAVEQSALPGNLRSLGIAVTENVQSIAPGTYPIGTTGTLSVVASYQITDSQCEGTTPDVATDGSVTFTTVDTSTLAGSFDLTFRDGQVTGSFSAPVCNPSTSTTITCSH